MRLMLLLLLLLLMLLQLLVFVSNTAVGLTTQAAISLPIATIFQRSKKWQPAEHC